MSTPSSVERSILATIVYHDIINFPLTAWECFQFGLQANTYYILQITDYRFSEVLNALDHLKSSGVIGEKNGFYFLKGRDPLYEERIERMKIAEEKWNNAAWVLKLYQCVPYVRAALLSGSVALGNATKHSDVDILIIAEKNRIWMVRFFLSFLTLLCGKLRAGRISKKTAGKICLNHYITTGSLALEARGLYNAATYIRFIPLFGADWLEKFYDSNPWIFDSFPQASVHVLNRRTFYPSSRMRGMQRVGEGMLGGIFGNIVEKVLALLQKAFISRHILSKEGFGRIKANNAELAFHPESPEGAILDKFNQKMLQSYAIRN